MDSIYCYPSSTEDFRMEKKCFHKLSDILLTGLLTCLSHGEDYEGMVLFGNTRERFLKEMIPPANGIPSHDTFNRVFSGLEPDLLRQCLKNYGRDLIGLLSEKQICLDGRKLKGVSPGSRGNTGLYIVNARVAENRPCTGQKRADDKSNEITAVPCLIEEPDIGDAVAGMTLSAVNVAQPVVLSKRRVIACWHSNRINLICLMMHPAVSGLARRRVFAKNGNMITGVMKHASAVS
ncbi:Transposase [Bacteroidales bacterium Barb6XT]|nr:Transposase [Bacteroidales bacterium Barb6XT]